MKLKDFFKKVGEFLKHAWDGAAKSWKLASPEVQAALKKASGIIAFINQEDLEGLIAKLTENFGISEDELHEALFEAADALNILQNINDTDLKTLVLNIKEYLDSKAGTKWANASEAAAKALAVFFAPKGTRWSVITQLIEYVYQTYIKKD